ncbi:MAG: UDP-2,3-diacylglucosamine diphosphatase LpxI [bacterium]|nr:UDP-2,3-diacylglucosamine diphosphatase LpxI [bacterium]
MNRISKQGEVLFERGRPFGLIAGGGGLPVEFVRNAERVGIEEIVAVGFRDYTAPEVAGRVAYYEEIGIGQLGRLIKIFRGRGVQEAVMLGSLSPRLTVANVRLDLRMLLLAARVRDRRADSVLGAIAGELEKEGIKLVATTQCLPHLLAQVGVMTKRGPTRREWEDIRFGIGVARASGALDIGQTVVVRKKAVVAVEGMEGTDACIKRAGTLVGGGVVVKMAKPGQDPRFDVPCVGTGTVEAMIEGECEVLAVEAGATFIVDRERVLGLADAHKIAIVGVRAEEGADLGVRVIREKA